MRILFEFIRFVGYGPKHFLLEKMEWRKIICGSQDCLIFSGEPKTIRCENCNKRYPKPFVDKT